MNGGWGGSRRELRSAFITVAEEGPGRGGHGVIVLKGRGAESCHDEKMVLEGGLGLAAKEVVGGGWTYFRGSGVTTRFVVLGYFSYKERVGTDWGGLTHRSFR